jgi:hypothetical protein
MPDPTLQAQLYTGTQTAQILRRVDAGTLSSYYVQGLVGYAGRARWVNVTTADTDNQKETAIRAALAA